MGAGVFSDNSLMRRIIVALVCAPVIVWIFLVRGLPLYVFFTALTLLGQWELFSMFGSRLNFPHRIVSYIAGLLIITDAVVNRSTFFSGILTFVIVIAFVIEIISGEKNRLEHVSLALFSTVYPAVFIAFLLRIDQFPSHFLGAYLRYIPVFVLLIIWIFDTASYFAGRAFGKHRFFPSVSPKKTLEGFVGGLVAGLVAGTAAGFFIDRFLMGHFIVLSLVISLSGQAGDLSESIIKRDMNTKDSSSIIPGHGGVLDRFDSLFFAGPAVYGYLAVCEWAMNRW